jgi:hypothetical protein
MPSHSDLGFQRLHDKAADQSVDAEEGKAKLVCVSKSKSLTILPSGRDADSASHVAVAVAAGRNLLLCGAHPILDGSRDYVVLCRLSCSMARIQERAEKEHLQKEILR